VDSERFDRLARLISNGSRRQVVSAGLAGAATLAGLVTAPETSAKRKKVQVEGPCGNGSARQNRCKRDGQCCTGYCRRKKHQKHGRCRCRKLNQTCRNDQSCCDNAGQPMSCVVGTCQPATTCVGQGGACGAGAACCTGLECQAGTCQETVLCVPLGGACTAGGDACCTDPGADATCTSGICRDPGYCETVLEAAGCEFLTGPGVWNCGNQDLTGVNLSGCDLPGASFFGTDVTNAIFTSTNLNGANFFDSNVTGAEWGNTTCPSGENSDANGDTCCGEFIAGQTPTGCQVG
jgi:hypothetical protein